MTNSRGGGGGGAAHRVRYGVVAKDADGVDLRQEEAAAVVDAGLCGDVRVAEEPGHLRHEVVAVVEAERLRHALLEARREAVVADPRAAKRVACDAVRRVPARPPGVGAWEKVSGRGR